MKYLAFVLIIGMSISACGDDDKFDSEVGYDQTMLNYIDAHDWDAIVLPGFPESMYFVIDEPGSEQKAAIGDIITIKYKGYYSDDAIFDQTAEGKDFTSRLDAGLIVGWQRGIPKFGKGGKGHLLIPPSLAYGENTNRVRPRSILIFDIELLDF